ncbi:MAG TPA: alcohol dehydrogenase catalytic domain-containing protein [Armatimonadota bacterium]|nr:alcohol dehydrogenase catalytic domain-containing protein [Armatimonadota bacterium]
MKAKAAIFVEERQPLVIDEIDIDGPREGEALVKLHATGICHTDLYTMSGRDASAYWPAVLGHEGGGEVVEVGKGVTSIEVGDHVVPLFISECGACPECRSTQTNLCSALDDTYYRGLMPDGTTRLHWKGKDLLHFMGTSTFAEYTVVPEIALARVRKDAPLERVCLLGCGITTGIGAARWTAKVTPRSTTAVFGCGPIGLNAVQGCALAGAGMVIALDLHDERLEMARAFGATHLVNASDGRGVERVKELTRGGADFTFEATGNVKVMRQAFEACHYGGGKCVVIGVAGKGEELSVVPRLLVSGRILTGTAFGGCKGRSQLPGLVDEYMAGKVHIDELVTREIPLEQINDALELMKQDKGYRYVVKY